MKYLYTTKPDEHCHEVEPGIYGRPAQTSEQPKLRKLGWVYNISELKGDDYVRETEEVQEGQESQEMNQFEADQEYGYLCEKYQEKFGKPPHHKMKTETIRKKLDESDE